VTHRCPISHGFRYIRVDDFPGTAEEAKIAVVGLFMHSDVAKHGNLTIDQTSSEGKILAAVHDSVVQTQACNLMSVPTDCPQREKRGWMGDAQWTAEEAILNFDMTGA
jgi:alpha-L-rhamnosidase